MTRCSRVQCLNGRRRRWAVRLSPSYTEQIMTRAFLSTLVLVLLTACSRQSDDSASSEWVKILHHKKTAISPSSSPQQKQVYADALQTFVHKNPGHSRAREVYQHIQLDFARELCAIGRYQDAIRFYRSILTHDPVNTAASTGLREAMDHLCVTREKLLTLDKGMTSHQVAAILGKPIPGWKVTLERNGYTTEAWYYRRLDGGIAAVHFIDGKLFAAEQSSDARLESLNAGLTR